jgi:hypothetical protein
MPEEYSEFLMDFVFKPYSNQLEVVANLFADCDRLTSSATKFVNNYTYLTKTSKEEALSIGTDMVVFLEHRLTLLTAASPTATAAALRAKKALRRYSTTEHVDESVPEECVELESGLTEDIEGMHEELEAKWKACSELKEKIEKLLADTKASSS